MCLFCAHDSPHGSHEYAVTDGAPHASPSSRMLPGIRGPSHNLLEGVSPAGRHIGYAHAVSRENRGKPNAVLDNPAYVVAVAFGLLELVGSAAPHKEQHACMYLRLHEVDWLVKQLWLLKHLPNSSLLSSRRRHERGARLLARGACVWIGFVGPEGLENP